MEYFDSCIADVIIVMRGYDDRYNDQWQIARYHGYLMYCANTPAKDQVEIYDFHPLPGDPTKQERETMKLTQRQLRLSRFIKKGLLPPTTNE